MQVEYEEAPATFSTSEVLPPQPTSDHSDEDDQDDEADVEEEEEEEEEQIGKSNDLVQS